MLQKLIPGYHLHSGSGLDRALLIKFMARTYAELYPEQDFSHLASTVEQYFSDKTPLWWVKKELDSDAMKPDLTLGQKLVIKAQSVVGCLWLGNSIDQVNGERNTHIFLLYVAPEYRRQGIGKALMNHAENWAKNRGYKSMSLQVFTNNQPAINLYEKLGYQTRCLLMFKSL